MKITYKSNNSGGGWWLSDEDWIALEKAGWDVVWGGLVFCKNNLTCSNTGVHGCCGHKACETYEDACNNRWLGAVATQASKEFASMKEAIVEFEEITGQDASDEGCNCCGAPHSFSSDGGDYASGEDCLNFLYENVPQTFRDAVRKLNEL